MNKRRWLSLALLIPLALGGLLVWTNVLFAATPVSPGENVSQTDDQSEGPQVAVSGTSLRAVWGERELNAVVVKEKTIGGSWSGETVFGDGTRTAQQQPDIAVAPNGTTYVAYAAGDEVLIRSKASGSNDWSGPRSVASDAFPNPVRIAIGPDGVIWVVWRNVDGSTIRYQRSSDGGNNWSGGDVASQSGNMFAPDVAVGPDGAAHVVWYLRTGGDNANTARIADWNGSGWNVGVVGGEGNYVADPVIAVERNNTVHVAYRRQRGDDWVIQHSWRAPGQGWTQEGVDFTSGDAGYAPGIAVDDLGGVHVTWSEFTSAGGRDVFYSVKRVGGRFEPPTNVSENPGGWNSRSTVATTASGANVTAHIFYQRGVRGRDVDEIYYRPYLTECITRPAAATNNVYHSPEDRAYGVGVDAASRIYLPLLVNQPASAMPTPTPGC